VSLPPLAPAIAGLETSRIAQVFELGFGRDNLIPLWVGEVPRGPNRHAACVHAVTGEVLTD